MAGKPGHAETNGVECMTGTSEELKQAWIKAWVAYGFGDYEAASRRFEVWLKRFKAESKQLSACWSARTMANCRQLLEEIHRHIRADGGRYGRPIDEQQRMNSAFWAGRHIMVLLSRQDRTMEGAVPIVKAAAPAAASPVRQAPASATGVTKKSAPAAAKVAPVPKKEAAKEVAPMAQPAPANKPAPKETFEASVPVNLSVPAPEPVLPAATQPEGPSAVESDAVPLEPEVEAGASAQDLKGEDLSLEDIDLSDLDETDLELEDMDLGELDLDDESLEGLDNLELDDLEGLDLEGLENMELDDLEGIE